MRYVYHPVRLRAWVREEIVGEEALFEFSLPPQLEPLKEGFAQARARGQMVLDRWVRGLSRLEKCLLPILFILDEREKGRLVLRPYIYRQLRDWRTFPFLVGFLYQRGVCFLYRQDQEHWYQLMWMWIRKAYFYRQEEIEKRMTPRQVKRWRKWLSHPMNPIKHLVEMALKEARYFDVIEEVGLTSDYPFFHRVWKVTLCEAPLEFFKREKKLCLALFAQGTSSFREKMVIHLVQREILDEVPELGDLIYEIMKTYRMEPHLWVNIPERERRNFHNWVVRRKKEKFSDFYDYFHERVRYWRKFIYRVQKVVPLFRRGEKAFLLYFSDVVVMEPIQGKQAGAAYVYRHSIFHKEFGKLVEEWEQNKKIRLKDFRNLDLIATEHKLDHRKKEGMTWQEFFDKQLSTCLGWDVSEDDEKEERE